MNLAFHTVLAGIVTLAALTAPAFSTPYTPEQPGPSSSIMEVSIRGDKSAEAFVSKVYYPTSAIINKNRPYTLDQDQEKRVLKIFSKHMDMTRMTSLALGQHWRNARPEQQAQLTREFSSILTRHYAAILAMYAQQPFTVHSGIDDQESHVRYLFSEERSGIAIDWNLYKSNGAYKIWNISVAGVSIVTNYRSEFSRLVAQNGIDGLIKRLADSNAAARSAK